MNKNEIVSSQEIDFHLSRGGWDGYSVDEGRLMLLELLSKAGAGCYNSHSEELFLGSFDLLRKDRMPNKRGMKFIMSMVYASSNKKPQCFNAMKLHRS